MNNSYHFFILIKCFFKGPGAGLVAAVMIAIVPGYISRSVAGSYDNEGKCYFYGNSFYI